MAEGWPTWKRSYPEDPKIDFLKSVEALIAWRNAHATGKEIWVTEFGWDASTKPNLKTGDFAKWEGNVSDEKQAQYVVRAFLVFAAMDVGRAYLYFFNDSDEPSFHAASGITRNFEPKPSFHARTRICTKRWRNIVSTGLCGKPRGTCTPTNSSTDQSRRKKFSSPGRRPNRGAGEESTCRSVRGPRSCRPKECR